MAPKSRRQRAGARNYHKRKDVVRVQELERPVETEVEVCQGNVSKDGMCSKTTRVAILYGLIYPHRWRERWLGEVGVWRESREW